MLGVTIINYNDTILLSQASSLDRCATGHPRKIFQLQKYLEVMKIFGSRYNTTHNHGFYIRVITVRRVTLCLFPEFKP